MEILELIFDVITGWIERRLLRKHKALPGSAEFDKQVNELIEKQKR